MKDYTIFTTPEQEQKRKDAMLALDSLKYNTMCYGCKALHKTCDGTTSKFYGGCIYREPNGLNAIFGFARFVPELIKNEDFSSYDEFLEELRSNRTGAVSLIWYDLPPVRCQSGAVSVMRYALHQSTKLADHLQLSCVEIKDGHIIPTSDRQYSTLDNSGFLEFFRDLPQKARINYLE